MIRYLLLAFLFSFLLPGIAGAACPNPNEPGGTSPEGAIVYNSAHHVPQFCDGTTWWAMKSGGGLPTCSEGETIIKTAGGWGCSSGGGGGGCTAPASCPNVGDVCADGSLFAGFMVYNGSCEPLYVTDNNQSTSSQWKTVNGTDDIPAPTDKEDALDGQYNHDNRGSGTFPAFELCEDNSYHGKSDWYLPARAELSLLWLNQAAIDANAAGNFSTNYYWSSTEFTTFHAWPQNFGDGDQYGNVKTGATAVRCVRRD